MSTNMYVGNLSYETNETDLENLFSEFGEIASVKLIKDRESGRSKGFAFVEMADGVEVDPIMEELNGCMFMDRQIVVNKARERQDNRRRRDNNRY